MNIQGIKRSLLIAAYNGYLAVVEKLIEAGSDVDLQNKGNGYTAGDMANQNSHKEIEFCKNCVYLLY